MPEDINNMNSKKNIKSIENITSKEKCNIKPTLNINNFPYKDVYKSIK
jgi:hypothetical protein